MIKKIVYKFLPNTQQRSLDVFLNIFYSFFLKFGVAASGIMLVPINLNYLETQDYGVWLTLSSITTWFYFFDIGLANGFRNKFTQAVAIENHLLARKYLSTTYAIICIICGSLIAVFELVNYFLDWNRILNTSMNLVTIQFLIQITFIMLCGKMILSILTTTLAAYHKVAISNTIEFLGSMFILLITFIISKTTDSNIVLIGIINSVTPVLLLIIASFLLYNSILKQYKPSFSFIDFKLSRLLFSKGIQFFLIQLAVMFMFTSNNVIISQLFGPEHVTPFSVINKYFSIPLMGFGIIIMPFWASFADAYFKNDIQWVKNMVKKLLYIWLALAVCLIVMVLILPFVLDIWIKRKLEFDQALIWYSALFVLLNGWGSIFSNFINAVDKIRVQFLGAIFLVFLNVPLSLFLCNYCNMGIEGIMLSSCICLLPSSILSPLQYYLIINKKAKGIWLK